MTSEIMILIYIGAVIVTYIILKLIGFKVDSDDPWDTIGTRALFSLFTGVTLFILLVIWVGAAVITFLEDRDPPKWL